MSAAETALHTQIHMLYSDHHGWLHGWLRKKMGCSHRAADLAHSVGAKLLLDGCQAVPRLGVDVAALGCDFYVFSAHKDRKSVV